MSLLCSSPPVAPHFSYSKSQSPHWPEALSDGATLSVPAFVTDDLVCDFPPPYCLPSSSSGLLPVPQTQGFLNLSATDTGAGTSFVVGAFEDV